MFLKQLEVGRLAVFAYLLGSDAGAEGLVIDPADDIDEILAIADQQKITIRYILNTHAHVDHIMGNEEIKKRPGPRSSSTKKMHRSSPGSLVVCSLCLGATLLPPLI